MEFYILIGLGVVELIVLLVLLFKKPADNTQSIRQLQKQVNDLEKQLAVITKTTEMTGRSIAEEFARSRQEMMQEQRSQRDENARSMQMVTQRLSEMMQANAEHQQRLMRVLHESIGQMQESNEKKLDLMRQTVDEKLTATLTTRLNSSFKTVSEQLEHVYKSLGEMKELSSGVTDNVTALNRVLTNVKARGTWAEVQLGAILDQTVPGRYETNFAPVPGSSERVEFAIKIPGEGDSITYLPIDSKFPMEDYIRLCAAADAGDAAALDIARKALENAVLKEAKAVNKYIHCPTTTPFAILYLATEGLYAEIASSRTGLPERLQNEFHIMVAGPTTITALLNSLAMGFRSIAINEKANEVRTLLAATKAQYEKFGAVLEKARKKIDEAGRSLTEAQDRNRIITKHLKNVDSLQEPEAAQILGLSEQFTEDET